MIISEIKLFMKEIAKIYKYNSYVSKFCFNLLPKIAIYYITMIITKVTKVAIVLMVTIVTSVTNIYLLQQKLASILASYSNNSICYYMNIMT